MAYVELDGIDKPKVEKTLVRDLDHDTIMEICLHMNPKLEMKDYRSLAGKMGLKWVYVKNLDLKNNPTEELLQHWWSGQGSKTVTDLITLLQEIDRHDVIDILRPVEYNVVQQQKRRPYSGASYSSNKGPTEHDLSDVSSTSPSDEELERHRTRSLPASEAPGAYKSSDASTVCNEGYDTDEELNRKLKSMGNGPTETLDDSICHPYYVFRKREGSSASISTAGSGSVSRQSVTMETSMQTDDRNDARSAGTGVYSPPYVGSPMVADVPPNICPITATDKVALLIGNRRYTKLPDEPVLCFPHKDVFDFRHALERLGFTVLSLVDLTLTEMRTVMLAFQKLLGPGAFAVFYFAGHGYEENGENYLMPIDASPSRTASEFIVAQEILLEMQLTKTALNLVIIDTCRIKGVNNSGIIRPYGLRKGSFGNTIIAYSCQSQMPAFEHQDQRNSVYMTELLRKIEEDRRIEHILMDVTTAVYGNPHVIQRPVFESDTIGDCRLTSRVIPDRDYDRDRTERWIAATTPPEAQTFLRKEEKLEFRFQYINFFCNVLEIGVYLRNLNEQPAFIENIALLNGEGLPVQANGICNVVSPVKYNDNWQQIHQFRITDLQKIQNKLLLVLQLAVCIRGEYGNANESYKIEFKLNADFPLVSSCLNDFRQWITGTSLAGHGKNTWV